MAMLALAGLFILSGEKPRLLCAAEEAAEAPDFKTHIEPILAAKCNRCHGEKRRGGKLDTRTVEAMLEGGASGPAIKPGNSKKSLLIELIHYDEMPPAKEQPRVTRDELQLLRVWVDRLPAAK